MDAALATLPILLTLLLLVTRLPGWMAPATGAVSAILLGLFWYGVPSADFLATGGESFWTLVQVLAIIAGGILLSRVMYHTGAQSSLAQWLSAKGPSVGAGLLMVNGVVPFMETVTGFGVAVLIGLPILLSFGFSPYRAAMLTLVGLMVSPWGSMGPSSIIAADIAGTGLTEMGLMSGWYNGVPFIISGIAAAIIAGREVHTHPGASTTFGWIGAGLLSAVALWGLVLGANALLGTPVAGAVATLIMSVAWLLIVRRGRLTGSPVRSLVPYLVLVAGTIAGQLINGATELGAFGAVLASPALWSTTGALVGIWVLSADRQLVAKLPREAGRMWRQVAVPTGLYVMLGMIIAAGGMAEALASSLDQLGSLALVVMPFLAGLSGYITASGTAANAMLGTTQVATADALGVSSGWAMGMQNSAAGWAIIASPARIELSYRLAVTAQRPEDPGPSLTRGMLLKGTLPLVLIAVISFGIINVIFLPLT